MVKLNKFEIKNVIKDMEKFYQNKKHTSIQKKFETRFKNLILENDRLKKKIGNLKIVASHQFLKKNTFFLR